MTEKPIREITRELYNSLSEIDRIVFDNRVRRGEARIIDDDKKKPDK